MASRAIGSRSHQYGPNLGAAERWASIIGGLGLMTVAVQRGPLARRIGVGLVGASLLARGATRFCGVKAAMTGQASLGEGLAKQAHYMVDLFRSSVGRITNLKDLQIAELQELCDAEAQFQTLLLELARAVHDTRLRQRLIDYAIEISPRQSVLESYVVQHAGDPWAHPDQAMQALVGEAEKMLRLDEDSLRDAAIIASVQRILHYRIATYGVVAAYAHTLGEAYHGSALSGFAGRDKEVDAQLSRLAESLINPSAASGTKSVPRMESVTANATSDAGLSEAPSPEALH